MTDQERYEKYKIPDFCANAPEPKVTYTWWTWHPNDTKWSKTVWKGETIEEANEVFTRHGFEFPYNECKLVKEYKGVYEVIETRACKRLDIWDKCIAQNLDMSNGKRTTRR